jgi:hypothetical protein
MNRRHPATWLTTVTLALLLAAALPVAASFPGGPAGNEFQVNTFTPGLQGYGIAASFAEGGIVVVWQSVGQDGDDAGVFGQRFDDLGARLGSEFQVSNVTIDGQRYPAVAGDEDGDFVVVWTDDRRDGSGTGLFGQRYASNGARLGAEIQINTFTSGSQGFKSAVSSDGLGNFVVAWTSFAQDGDRGGIFARRFSSSGSPAGGEFQASTYTSSVQGYDVALARQADGSFLVAWDSLAQDGDSWGIFAQPFDASGVPVGSELQVNSFTVGPQGGDYASPAIATGADSGFIVTWGSFAQDGSGRGVFAQRFDSLGARLGAEFQVNTYTIFEQAQRVAASADSAGNFVVAWGSVGQDGSGPGVFGQRFDAGGSTIGSEFLVSSGTLGDQGYGLAIASEGTGDFLVAWGSSPQFSDIHTDVLAQRYEVADVSGRIRYFRDARPVAAVEVTLSGVSPAEMTDATGEYAFEDVEPGPHSLVPRKLGDFRGAVTSLDAAFALQNAVGLRTFDPIQKLACDVTGNGTVSSLDAALILQLRVGIIGRFPVAEACESDWIFTPDPLAASSQTVNDPQVTSNPCQLGSIAFDSLPRPVHGQGFDAALFGDCTGNWTPSP